MKLGGKRDIVKEAIDWAKPLLADGPVLIYSSAEADVVKKVQRKHSIAKSSALVENCLAKISKELVRAGVGRLIVVGGITASESMKALNIRSLQIGNKICPGVPWTATVDDPPLHLALKAGHFGEEDFFTRAFQVLK